MWPYNSHSLTFTEGFIPMLLLQILLAWLVLSPIAAASSPQTLAPDDTVTDGYMNRQLKHQGLTGYIHAANTATKTVVLTVNEPGGKSRNVALIAETPALWNQLNTLQRYDLVRVKGERVYRLYPQAHVVINRLTVLKRWQPDVAKGLPALHADPNLANPFMALIDQPTLTGTIHAVAGQGHVLLLDYKGAVYPLVAPDNTQTQHLWRGDRVTLRLSMMVTPNSPLHLMLEPATPGDTKRPVDVLEAIKTLHNQPTEAKGYLVLYPKSPAMAKDSWALAHTLPEGGVRYYLLESAWGKQGQMSLDRYLAHLWQSDPHAAEAGRQKWLKPQLLLQAKGLVWVEQPNQFQPRLRVNGPGFIKRLPKAPSQ